MNAAALAFLYTSILAQAWGVGGLPHGTMMRGTVLIAALAVALPARRRSGTWGYMHFEYRPPLTVEGTQPLFVLVAGFLAAFSAIIIAGVFANPGFVETPGLVRKLGTDAARYYPWALLQQFLLTVVFAFQLERTVKNSLYATFLVGMLFALVHIPNFLLVAVCLFSGAASAYLFLWRRSVWLLPALAAAHALIAVAIKNIIAPPMGLHIGRSCLALLKH